MRFVILALPLLLADCGTITNIVAPSYDPVPIHVFDQPQYEADLVECRAAGLAYRPTFSVAEALSKTIRGATSNSSLIPVSPLVPAYGAAGAALGAASDGLDVMSGQHSAVFRNCLHDITQIDHSAVLVNPKE